MDGPLILYLLLLLCSALFSLKWHKKLLPYLPKTYVLIGLFLKISAAYSLWLVYTYYYSDRTTADIFNYFDDASTIFEATKDQLSLRWQLILGIADRGEKINAILANTLYWDTSSSFLFNDNRSMIRLHLLLYHFSQGFYQFHLLFFALLSFLGSAGLYRFFTAYSKLNRKIIYALVFLTPSFLFWCSAPIKECLLLFGLGTFLFSLTKIITDRKQVYWIILILSFFILLSIKIYFLLALTPALLFLLVSSSYKRKAQIPIFLAIHMLFLLAFFVAKTKIIATLNQKLLDFKLHATAVQASSMVEISNYSDFKGFLTAVPRAIYNVLFRAAFPMDSSLFSVMAGLETLGLIILLLLPFLFYRNPNKQEKRLALFCFSFVITGAIIIGLTCPVLGAILRYKAPLLPFYIILLLTFVDLERIKRLFIK